VTPEDRGPNPSCFFKVRPSAEFAKEHFDSIDTLVEVGVFWGSNARLMWNHLRPRMTYLIDPYKVYSENSQDQNSWTRNKELAIFSTAIIPSKFLFLPSLRASGFVPNELDMVYLDGAHDYDNVVADIRCWWKKLRIGGLLCGHDYNNDWDCPDVKVAVDELFPSASTDSCDWWIVKETGDELRKAD